MNFLEDILSENQRPVGYAETLCLGLTLVANITERLGQDSKVNLLKIMHAVDSDIKSPFIAISRLQELVSYTEPKNRHHIESIFEYTANFSRIAKSNILLNCLKISTISLGDIEHHVHSINKIGRLMQMNHKELSREVAKAINLIEHDFTDFMETFQRAQSF